MGAGSLEWEERTRKKTPAAIAAIVATPPKRNSAPPFFSLFSSDCACACARIDGAEFTAAGTTLGALGRACEMGDCETGACASGACEGGAWDERGAASSSNNP